MIRPSAHVSLLVMAGTVALISGCHPERSVPGGASGFSATRLSNPLGGAVTEAYDIDDRNRVVGRANMPKSAGAHSHAMIWDNGTATDLGTLDNGGSEADVITADGNVYGWSSLKKIHIHAVWFSPSGPSDLGVADGAASVVGAAENGGRAVLVVNETTGPTRSYQTQSAGASGRPITLGSLPGYRNLTATAMNADTIVGTADSDTASRAFYWNEGVLKALNPPAGWPDSYAYAIGTDGAIAGAVSGGGVNYKAVVWVGGIPQLLPSSTTKNAQALGINGRGDVVGTCNGHGCLWRHGKNGYEKLVDLNSVCRTQGGDELETATAINAAGCIVCNTSPAKGLQAYLLEPNHPQ